VRPLIVYLSPLPSERCFWNPPPVASFSQQLWRGLLSLFSHTVCVFNLWLRSCYPPRAGGGFQVRTFSGYWFFPFFFCIVCGRFPWLSFLPPPNRCIRIPQDDVTQTLQGEDWCNWCSTAFAHAPSFIFPARIQKQC